MTTTNTQSPDTPLPITVDTNTNLPIRADLANDQGSYFARNNLLAALPSESITMLEKYGAISNSYEVVKRYSSTILVIHLVRKDAIVLTVHFEDGYSAIQSISVNVSLLLYGHRDYPVVARDIYAAKSILIDVVSPLLKDSLRDAVGIVSGLESGDTRRAFFSEACVTMELHGVNVRDIYVREVGYDRYKNPYDESISHIDFLNYESVSIKNTKLTSSSNTELDQEISSKALLSVSFTHPEWAGDPPDGSRVFNLRKANIAPRFHKKIQSLNAIHLPTPVGIRGESDMVKLARAIAMNSVLEHREGQLMDFAARFLKSRSSSLKELKAAVAAEKARLKPVPLAKLVDDACALQATRRIHNIDWPIHPLISAALG